MAQVFAFGCHIAYTIIQTKQAYECEFEPFTNFGYIPG